MRLALCVAVGIALAPTMGLGADPYMVLADGCVACHGADGGTVASLSGKPADQLKAALAQFKNGSRPATVMDRIARGYSERQIGAIAIYWAEQTAPGGGQ